VNAHGHRRPEIDAAIRAQLDRVAHATFLGLTNAPAAALAARLIEVAPPGLERVFFSESGASACEVAIKVALRHHQLRGRPERRRMVGLRHAYHGDTLGAVALGGIDAFHASFRPLLFDALHAPQPMEDPDADGLRRLLEAHPGEVAAVMLEPLVQAAAGILDAPDGYLRRVRELCDEHGALLIFDEVATGMGRTGTMFACEQEGVAPDVLCVGKGLSGGYLPLSATLVTGEVFAPFLGGPSTTFFHGHSFSGNPLACAAALASLDLYAREGRLENVRRQSAQLRAALAPLGLPIRGRGLLLGIVGGGAPVCRAALEEGIVIRPLGEVVVVAPPLVIDDDESQALAEGLLRAYAAVHVGV
jgi:adenosylmethionine-8-amino-7-oxononanoate aminotransferase